MKRELLSIFIGRNLAWLGLRLMRPDAFRCSSKPQIALVLLEDSVQSIASVDSQSLKAKALAPSKPFLLFPGRIQRSKVSR